MGPAQAMGQVFFPLDEELSLQLGSLTPRQQEHLTHLATWMPFERAAQMLERLLGVQVSEPTVRRGTERAESRYEAHQTARSQQSAQAARAESTSEHQAISIDGAYVSLVGGAWAEVRTVAIGAVKKALSSTGQCEVQTCHLSYFSHMTDAEIFGDVAQVEMHQQGVSQASAVCAVTDGADGIQGFVDEAAT